MPQRKYRTLKRYKPLLFPAAILIIIIIIVSLLVRSCGKDEGEHAPNDTESFADSADTEKEDDDKNNGLIYIPVGRDTENDNANETPTPSGVTKEALIKSKLVITQDLGAEYIEKFYFLCDSPLYGLKTYGMLSEGIETDRVISGISSSFSLLFSEEALVYDTVTSQVMSVYDKIKSVSPEYLLVSVGSDDIKMHHGMSFSFFKESYTELLNTIKKASPKTTVICMPIIPGTSGDGLSVFAAERYNEYIHEACAECGVYYIDIASAFASSGGYLRIDCDGGNSRLNTTGLKRLLELLRTYTAPAET